MSFRRLFYWSFGWFTLILPASIFISWFFFLSIMLIHWFLAFMWLFSRCLWQIVIFLLNKNSNLEKYFIFRLFMYFIRFMVILFYDLDLFLVNFTIKFNQIKNIIFKSIYVIFGISPIKNIKHLYKLYKKLPPYWVPFKFKVQLYYWIYYMHYKPIWNHYNFEFWKRWYRIRYWHRRSELISRLKRFYREFARNKGWNRTRRLRYYIKRKIWKIRVKLLKKKFKFKLKLKYRKLYISTMLGYFFKLEWYRFKWHYKLRKKYRKVIRVIKIVFFFERLLFILKMKILKQCLLIKIRFYTNIFNNIYEILKECLLTQITFYRIFKQYILERFH